MFDTIHFGLRKRLAGNGASESIHSMRSVLPPLSPALHLLLHTLQLWLILLVAVQVPPEMLKRGWPSRVEAIGSLSLLTPVEKAAFEDDTSLHLPIREPEPQDWLAQQAEKARPMISSGSSSHVSNRARISARLASCRSASSARSRPRSRSCASTASASSRSRHAFSRLCPLRRCLRKHGSIKTRRNANC